MKPTMILLAGPNGAGKSTLYETRVAPSFAGPFINADIIQRDAAPEVSYEAPPRAAPNFSLKGRGSIAPI